MATIHFVDGEKGGVGKSLVSRTMIQYRLDRDLPFVAVETDRSNPDVAGIYKGMCQYAVFTEDERQVDKADKVFEMAIDKPVIVNLAAQAHRVRFGLDKCGQPCFEWLVVHHELSVLKAVHICPDLFQGLCSSGLKEIS